MKNIFTLLIALPAVAFTAQAQNTWTQKADLGGTARAYMVGFSIGSKGYAGTGSDGSITEKDFWEYDPSTDAWSQKADFGGTARYAATGFSIGSKGYIGTGGNYNGGWEKDFWEYDPVLNTWTKKADFGGIKRSYAVGFSIGSKGYIGTGSKYPNPTYFKDFWEYDPTTDTWTQKADFGGGGRLTAAGFSIGSKGYVGTGIDNVIGYAKDFWEYDPSTDVWSKKSDFGGSVRQGAVGFNIGSKGYIGTGYYAGTSYKDFWEYDPAINAWTKKADFAGAARLEATGFSIGTKGYIGVGWNGPGSNSYNDFWEYTPDTSSTIGCAFPTGETTSNITDGSAKLKWDDEVGAYRYKARYKVTGTNGWTTITNISPNYKTISPLSPNTSYTWQVKSVCGAQPIVSSDWSAKQTFTTGSWRLEEEASQNISLDLFPNPNEGNITIEVTLPQQELLSIKVFDVVGREVFSSEEGIVSGTFTKQLDLSNLSSGTYFLKVIHGGVSVAGAPYGEMRNIIIEK